MRVGVDRVQLVALSTVARRRRRLCARAARQQSSLLGQSFLYKFRVFVVSQRFFVRSFVRCAERRLAALFALRARRSAAVHCRTLHCTPNELLSLRRWVFASDARVGTAVGARVVESVVRRSQQIRRCVLFGVTRCLGILTLPCPIRAHSTALRVSVAIASAAAVALCRVKTIHKRL